ncbi:MAG: sulfatase-like hydrolase/transferase, partial [Planctomycetes bacterium]|nr:sulfatase-like hydrolase/transferase [Planctomycetota bacterium]
MTRSPFRRLAAVALLVALCGSTRLTAQDHNVLILLADDLGVDQVGCYGEGANPAPTPNIDALAKQGFQYMHCYANAPVCAPSRSTWITGVHAISMGT